MSAAHGAWRKRRRPKPRRRGLLLNPLRRIISLGRRGDGARRPTDVVQGDSSWPSDAIDVIGAQRARKLSGARMGKMDRRGAAHQAFVLAALVFRHRIGGSENRQVRLRRTQAFLGKAQKAQCDDAEAHFLVRHHSATRVSVRSARPHTHSEKRFPRIRAGLVRIASSSKARTTVKPAAMLKTRIGGVRSPSA
jgi:hypothetical protein